MPTDNDGLEFEVLEMRRKEDGTMEAHIRYEQTGLEAYRQVKAVELSAVVHRAATDTDENLGVIAGTYSNPATELRKRAEGLGSVQIEGDY